jgi:hypothetical protein
MEDEPFNCCNVCEIDIYSGNHNICMNSQCENRYFCDSCYECYYKHFKKYIEEKGIEEKFEDTRYSSDYNILCKECLKEYMYKYSKLTLSDM